MERSRQLLSARRCLRGPCFLLLQPQLHGLELARFRHKPEHFGLEHCELVRNCARLVRCQYLYLCTSKASKLRAVLVA
jgi:hypothetical protein